MVIKNSILIALFLSLPMSALAQRAFVLAPEKCVLTGEDDGKVTVLEGDKTELKCNLVSAKLNCGQAGKPMESYEALFEDDILIARSASGNIFVLGNFKKKTYSTASSHLIPEKGMLMTKHCSGKIK